MSVALSNPSTETVAMPQNGILLAITRQKKEVVNQLLSTQQNVVQVVDQVSKSCFTNNEEISVLREKIATLETRLDNERTLNAAETKALREENTALKAEHQTLAERFNQIEQQFKALNATIVNQSDQIYMLRKHIKLIYMIEPAKQSSRRLGDKMSYGYLSANIIVKNPGPWQRPFDAFDDFDLK